MKTAKISEVVKFYQEIIGCERWLSQPDIEILKHDNFIIGFHANREPDAAGLFTFFYKSREEVDEMYSKLNSLNLTSTQPQVNDRYQIYNFFARDIEGRKIEFQTFLHDLPPI